MPGFSVEIAEYEAVLRHAESSVLYTLELVERGLRIEREALPWYRRWFCKPAMPTSPLRALEHVRGLLGRLEAWKMECPDLEVVKVPAWPDPMFCKWVELARDYRCGSSFPPPVNPEQKNVLWKK